MGHEGIRSQSSPLGWLSQAFTGHCFSYTERSYTYGLCFCRQASCTFGGGLHPGHCGLEKLENSEENLGEEGSNLLQASLHASLGGQSRYFGSPTLVYEPETRPHIRPALNTGLEESEMFGTHSQVTGPLSQRLRNDLEYER